MKTCLSILVLVVPFLFLVLASSTREESATSHCAPKRFTKTIVSCCGLPAFYWDGSQCVDATSLRGKCGCVCSGHDGKLGSKDCDAIFETREACESHYADC